jgi:sugar phosphate isomerase/epimerase
LSRAVKAPRPLIALSTASVFPDRTPDAFEAAARLGYDGVEVMVSADTISQDVDVLRRLVDYHGVPVLAVHAPCLLITQRVWGLEPWGKLIRAKDMAEKLGARVVVMHPPFRWQRDYARDFGSGLERMSEETDVVFAVENMYPLRAGGAEVAAYAPNWNPVLMDVPHVTLDLSHTAASGSDALAMAEELGSRLSHVHMADGTGVTNRDEHLVPGRGAQPCAPLLEKLAADRYPGTVVLEVNTRRAISREARLADLTESLEFTRKHLGRPGPAGAGPAAAGGGRAQAGDGRARAGGRASWEASPGAAGAGAAGAGAAGMRTAGPRGSVLPACR